MNVNPRSALYKFKDFIMNFTSLDSDGKMIINQSDKLGEIRI